MLGGKCSPVCVQAGCVQKTVTLVRQAFFFKPKFGLTPGSTQIHYRLGHLCHPYRHKQTTDVVSSFGIIKGLDML